MYLSVCTWVCACATAPPWWQGVSIMINRQTRQLSHAITLHYGSQDFKVKMNGSSSTWRLHISSFFCFPSLLFFGADLTIFSQPPFWCDHLCFCHCLKCMAGHGVWKKNKKEIYSLHCFLLGNLKSVNLRVFLYSHLHMGERMYERSYGSNVTTRGQNELSNESYYIYPYQDLLIHDLATNNS